jgi:hypothetical protein
VNIVWTQKVTAGACGEAQPCLNAGLKSALECRQCFGNVWKGLYQKEIDASLSKDGGQSVMDWTRISRGEIGTVAVRMGRDASGDPAAGVALAACFGQVYRLGC